MAQLTGMINISLEELETHLGVRKFPAYVRHCEQQFFNQLNHTMQAVLNLPSVHSIFVSGPTASGKTTFSHRLARLLSDAGRPTRVLSLDDYYRTGPVSFDDAGRPDYESIEMLDTDALVSDLMALFAGQTVSLPTFDFVNRARIFEPEKVVTLHQKDLLIIEGLHGLSDQIIGHLPGREVFGVFIMPWCSFLDGRQLLGSRDLRMLRRISRDVLHRGSTALSTIDYWPMIDHTERQFFPTYLARADRYINSCLSYEFCIIPPLASSRIQESLDQHDQGILAGSIYLTDRDGYADLPTALQEADELLSACERLPAADPSVIPQESILQEFI